MVRAMLIVVAFGGAAAEQNVTTTTTTIRDGPGAPPQTVRDGCFGHQQFFQAGAQTKKHCNTVCEQITLMNGNPLALDFMIGAKTGDTMKEKIAENLIANLAGLTKKRCYGCPSFRNNHHVEEVCEQNNGQLCFTQSQINAGKVKFPHGCWYGSKSNTCAYEGAYKGQELIVEDIMPEETCRYSVIGNTGIPALDAIDKMVEGSPIEV